MKKDERSSLTNTKLCNFLLLISMQCNTQAHALPGVSHHRIPRPSRVFSRGANPRALSNTDLDVASPRFARSRRKQTSAFRNPCRGSTKTRCKPPSRSRRTSRWTSCVPPTWPSVSACLRRRPSPSRSTLSEFKNPTSASAAWRRVAAPSPLNAPVSFDKTRASEVRVCDTFAPAFSRDRRATRRAHPAAPRSTHLRAHPQARYARHLHPRPPPAPPPRDGTPRRQLPAQQHIPEESLL